MSESEPDVRKLKSFLFTVHSVRKVMCLGNSFKPAGMSGCQLPMTLLKSSSEVCQEAENIHGGQPRLPPLCS